MVENVGVITMIKLKRLVESNKKHLGYKVIGYDANKKRAFSLYDSRRTYKVKVGMIERDDKHGLYLGTTRNFPLDYYSGQTDFDDLLLTCEYTDTDIIKGTPTDKNSEILVRQYKIVKIEFIKNEYV